MMPFAIGAEFVLSQVSEAGPRGLGLVADYILPAAFFATSRSLSSSVAAIAVPSFALAAVS